MSPYIANQCPPGGLELVSPIFRVQRNSSWRKDVELTWSCLRRHYHITEDFKCATHIHISFEAPQEFTADDIRRIARSILHFETAFEVLVPPTRRGNHFAKSNWLEGQHLGRKGKTRIESIDAFDTAPTEDEAGDIDTIIEILQDFHDRDYCWNFNNLSWGKGTIEFRKPPASTTADEALSWAELVICFVQAAVKHGIREKLEKVPSNVGGLKWFLQQAYEPGVNEPDRLERIWAGIPDNAALEPQLADEEYWGEEMRRLERKLRAVVAADKARILEFAKTAQKPYWTKVGILTAAPRAI